MYNKYIVNIYKCQALDQLEYPILEPYHNICGVTFNFPFHPIFGILACYI